MKRLKKNCGFTLMEMMMVVAIICVSAAVSGFTFNKMLPDMRVKAAAKQIKSDLNLARLKAVRENAEVTIDFSNDKGYEIYMTNSDDSKLVLKTVDYPDGVATQEDGVSFSSGSKAISFDGRGLPNRKGHVYLVNAKKTFSGVKISFLGKTTTLYKPE